MKPLSSFLAVALGVIGLAPNLSFASANVDTMPPAANASHVINSNATNPTVVNLNTADAASLTAIKGLGNTKAQAIVNYRQQHGRFASVSDLEKVPGIGPKLYAKIQNQVTVSH